MGGEGTYKGVLVDKCMAFLLRRLQIRPGRPEQERWCVFVARRRAFLSAPIRYQKQH